MNLAPSLLHDLIHCCPEASLASHSTQLPGYPFASAVEVAPDSCHRPVFVMSQLAEHTRNLLADARASLLLVAPGPGPVLQRARATLIGHCEPCHPGFDEEKRWLRYLPDAAEYLALGDFQWFRLQPERARYVGGFGRMGWFELDSWAQRQPAEPDEPLLEAAQSLLSEHERLLGMDQHGADIAFAGRRIRLNFAEPARDHRQGLKLLQHALAEPPPWRQEA